ncbi:MAG: hypothetical protein M3N54_12525 [Acidobacteriota bacterium]|nr:hypothetical protein [Acidobacteriota bacterium]
MIDLNSLRRIDEESGDLIDIIYEPAPAPISPINSGTWSFPQIQKMNKLQQKYLNMAHAGELDAVHAVADQLTAIRGRLGYGAFMPMSDFAIVAEGRDRRAKLAQWLIGEMSNDPPTPGSAGPFFFSAKGFIELKAYAAAN